MAWQAIVKFAVQVVGSYLISSLLTPSVRQTGSRLEDKSAQTSTYGATISRIHGVCAVTGNVIWLKGNQLFDISVTAKGKKTSIGGSRSRTTVFPVFATFAVGLCEGPIAGIRRLWIGSDLVYDAGSDDIETIIASNQRVGGDPLAELPQNIVFKGDVSSISERLPPWTFKIFYGTEGQEPSVAQEADKGVGNVPAYRGIAYIEIYNLPLEKYGNSLAGAQVKAEIVRDATTAVENVSSVRKTVPRIDEFAAQPNYIDTEKTVYWKPNWDNTYPSTSTVDRYDMYHNTGLLIHIETRAITGISATLRTGNPPNGDSDDPTEFWSGRGRVFPGAIVGGLGNFNDGDGYIQRRGDVYAGISEWAPKTLHRNTRYNVILNNPGISKESSAFCFMIDGDQIYEFTPTAVNVLNASLATVATYSITFGTGITSHYPRIRAQRDGNKIYLLIAKETTPPDAAPWGYAEATDIHEVDLSALTVTKVYEDVPGRNNEHWTVHLKAGDSYIKSGSNATADTSFHRLESDVVKLEQSTPTAPTLGSVVSNEVQLSNYLSASDIDVTDLSDTVRGYRITDTGTIRSHIEPLQAVWPFDVYQSGYKLKFVRRGNASVVSIPASKLDARPYGAAPGTELNIEREMDSQLPREVALKHLDAQREYDIGEQRAERKTTDSINKIELEIPVSLTATEAAQAVEVMLWMAWGDRHNVSFSLPPEYGNLEPTDVITITGQWGVYTLRLGDVDYKTDGRVVCTNAKFESAASYVSTAVGSESGVNEQTLGFSGSTVYEILDIPCIADEFNIPGALVGMSGYSTGWPGGVLWRSQDGGATWEDVLAFPYAVTIGFAQNAIGTAATDRVDFSSALEVVFPKDSPSTITYDELLDFGNYFAYGAHGRWEIIAAQVVTVSGDSHILTNLLRGRFGTEWAMDTHTSLDMLVMLSDNDIQWLHQSAVNDSASFLGVTADRELDTAQQETFTYTGVNLKPLSGVYAKGSRHPTTDDWTATWIRRGRISVQWQDYIDVPVGEDTEAYEVDVLAYAGGPVLNTLSVTTPAIAYTEAQQLTDAEFVRSKLALNIYQMSATIGRGYVYSVVLEQDHTQPYETLIAGRTPTRYWKLNETSGATVADSSGAADDLTLTGTGYTRNEDPLIHNQGRSTLFGGAAYLPVASNPLANPQRSYEAWVEYAGSGEQRIYDWQDSVGYFLLRRTSGGLIEAIFQTGGVNRSVTASVPAGVFHVVVTHSTTGTMTLYLNGLSAGSITSAAANTGTGTDRAIGRTRNTGTNFWQGHMDQIALYGSELSADQVLHNYMAGIGQ